MVCEVLRPPGVVAEALPLSLNSLRFRVEPEFHRLHSSKDKALLVVRLVQARSLVAQGNEIPQKVRVLIKIVQRNGLEGLVQRMAVLLRNNSKSRKLVPRAIYLRLVAANCGTRLVMTTGRLNAWLVQRSYVQYCQMQFGEKHEYLLLTTKQAKCTIYIGSMVDPGFDWM